MRKILEAIPRFVNAAMKLEVITTQINEVAFCSEGAMRGMKRRQGNAVKELRNAANELFALLRDVYPERTKDNQKLKVIWPTYLNDIEINPTHPRIQLLVRQVLGFLPECIDPKPTHGVSRAAGPGGLRRTR